MPGGQHFHHAGDFAYTNADRRLVFTSRLRLASDVFVQRWAVEVVTPHVLIGRGEVYRWYAAVEGAASSAERPPVRP